MSPGIYRSIAPICDTAPMESLSSSNGQQNLGTLQLKFFRTQLTSYKKWRIAGLDRKSVNWMNKAAEILWDCTNGIISKVTLDMVRDNVLRKYSCFYAKRKVLNFTKGFLKFLTKTTFDTRYLAYELFLEMPKALKTRKHVTSRIVTKKDVENVLGAIEQAHNQGRVDDSHFLNYKALILFGALTGQRSMATIMKLTVGQLRESLRVPKPVLRVEPHQDKIRMEHYVPLHPQAIEVIQPLLDGKKDGDAMFHHGSFWMWVKRQKIPMSRFGGHFVLGDLRKFTEQHGDILEWDQSNRAYILSHGLSGIEWRYYRHPLPDSVYDIYMKYWADVSFEV